MARLVIEWPDGDRLSHPLPLPPCGAVADPTPCQYVAMLQHVLGPSRRTGMAVWVEP
jgi:hypothetical protein